MSNGDDEGVLPQGVGLVQPADLCSGFTMDNGAISSLEVKALGRNAAGEDRKC